MDHEMISFKEFSTINTNGFHIKNIASSIENNIFFNESASLLLPLSSSTSSLLLLPSSSISSSTILQSSSALTLTSSSSSPSSSSSSSSLVLGNITDDIYSIEKGNDYSRVYKALKLYNGIIDKRYIERINKFWLQFEPYSAQTHYVIAFIYVIITIIGCCGNALVVLMFIRCKSLRTPANTLVINLAVSDFFMVAKGPIAIYNSLKLGPALGDLGCRMYGFIGGLTGTASIMTLTAISIDRYHVVVYPLDPLRSTTKFRSIAMLIFVWIYSLVFSIIPALDIGLSTYVPEGLLTTCSFDYLSKAVKARIFMFIFFVAAWCIPFTTITYCYFYIMKVVIAAKSIQSSKDKNRTEIKLAIILICIIGLWFLAWTPYAIVALLGITGNEKFLTPLLSMIPAIFCKTSACIDPYVYAVTHPRFKMELKRIFQRRNIQRASTYRSYYARTSKSRISIDHKVVIISDISNSNDNDDEKNDTNKRNKKEQQMIEMTIVNDKTLLNNSQPKGHICNELSSSDSNKF